MFAACRYCAYDGSVLSECAQQIRKINSNLMIGFGGDEVLIKALERNILSFSPINTFDFETFLFLIQNKFEFLLPEIYQHMENNQYFSANIGVAANCDDMIRLASIHLHRDTIKIEMRNFASEDDVGLCCIDAGITDLDKKF